MENPFVQLREKSGMTRREFAIATGLTYGQVYDCEMGQVLQPSARVLTALRKSGVDTVQLTKAYVSWREEQRKALS